MSVERRYDPDEWITVNLSLRFDPRAFDCAHCPLLETYARKQCRCTGEYIYTDKNIGTFCPFDITNEIRDKILLAKENEK